MSPELSSSNDEFSLIKNNIDKRVEYEVTSAEHVANIRRASEMKTQSFVLAGQLEKFQKEQEAYLKTLKAERDAKLKQIEDELEAKLAASNLAAEEEEKLRRQADRDSRAAVKALKEAEAKYEEDLSKKQEALAKQRAADKDKIEKLTYQAVKKYNENLYTSASLSEKKLLNDKRVNAAVHYKEQLQQDKYVNEEAKQNLKSKIKSARKQLRDLKKESASDEQINAAQANINQLLENRKSITDEGKRLDATIQSAEAEAVAAQVEQKHVEDILNKIHLSRSGRVQALNEEISQLTKDFREKEYALQEEKQQLEAKLAEAKESGNKKDTAAALEAALKQNSDKLVEATKTYDESLKGLEDKRADAGKSTDEDKNKAKMDAAAKVREDYVKKLQQKEEEEAYKQAEEEYLASDEGKEALALKQAEEEEEAQKAREKAQKEMVEHLNKLADQLNSAVDQNISAFFQYKGTIDARLQGSGKSFHDMSNLVSNTIRFSGITKQTDVINKIKELSDAGIAHNIELRAFLATVSDKIASTFDIFDSNLTRLIRIQQADITASRLGMEASLTKLFNKYFSDTSYLTDAFDSVAGILIDANAQLNRDQSAEFDFILQKWLGALYSVGVSSSGVSTIAQGITYLATGNVEALEGNDSLRTLLAMSAAKAGIPYADMLIEGVNGQTANKLLQAMVEYLKQIAESEDNKVVRSAYSDVFGINTTDVLALSNLSSSVINSIANETLSYSASVQEAQSQLTAVASRMHLSQLIENAFANVLTSTSQNIGNSALIYGTWKALGVADSLVDIALPFVNVMGFGLDFNSDLINLIKMGMVGFSFFSELIAGLGSGNMFGTDALSLGAWGFDEYISSGSRKGVQTLGSGFGTSESYAMNEKGSTSADDIKTTTLTDTREDAEKDEDISNTERREEYDKIEEAIRSDTTTVLEEAIAIRKLLETGVKVTVGEELQNLLAPSRVFHSSIVNVASSEQGILAMDRSTGITNFIDNYMAETALPLLQSTELVKLRMNTTALGGSSGGSSASTTSEGLRDESSVGPSYASNMIESPEFVTAYDYMQFALNGLLLSTSSPTYVKLLGSEVDSAKSNFSKAVSDVTNNIAKLEASEWADAAWDEVNDKDRTAVIQEIESSATKRVLEAESQVSLSKFLSTISVNRLDQIKDTKSAVDTATVKNTLTSVLKTPDEAYRKQLETEAMTAQVLKQALKEIFTENTLTVNVSNDYFEEFLQTSLRG